MSMLQRMVVLVLGIIVIVMVGCTAWQQGLTPAYIDPVAIEYSETGATVFTPYTSLWDAYRIDRELDYRHVVNQVEVYRHIEDDNLRYDHIKNAMQVNIQSAEELRGTIFDAESGILPLLLAGSGFGIGALAVSKPADKRKITELQNGGSK